MFPTAVELTGLAERVDVSLSGPLKLEGYSIAPLLHDHALHEREPLVGGTMALALGLTVATKMTLILALALVGFGFGFWLLAFDFGYVFGFGFGFDVVFGFGM
jgi:hypothetical protein